jgi:sec-independent protein translocase protein TatA
MFGFGFQELLIVGVVAVLLFGKRLPDVARTFGAQYREFRKGLSEFQSQIDFTDTYNSAPSKPKPAHKSYSDYDDHDEVSAPKFEPPPAAPVLDDSAREAG